MAWILIADDDDDLVRTLWAETLTQAGYRTVEARTGREAIELMRTVVPDLMILDLHMPELAGEAVLRHLQGWPVLPRIPVLIISGFLDEEEHDAGDGLNIVGRLAKPQPLASLVATVREAVQRSRPVKPVSHLTCGPHWCETLESTPDWGTRS